MKTIQYLILSMVFLSLGCERNEELYFANETKGLNIWLGSGGAPVDSITYNFSYVIEGRDSILFNYRLLGYPLDHDVDFELEAVDGDTDLVYYAFGKYTLKAGTYQGQFPIYLDKPEAYQESKEKSGKIVFRFKENEELKSGAKERTELHLVLQNKISKPDHWDVAPLYYLNLSRYFGTYSDKKYSFIIQVTGNANFTVYSTLNAVTQLDENAISSGMATYYQQECKKALEAYNLEHGSPLLDENNNEVVFP